MSLIEKYTIISLVYILYMYNLLYVHVQHVYNAMHMYIHVLYTAQEMTRHDNVVELLQQRQEKDITQLNKVSHTHTHTHTHTPLSLSSSQSLTEYRKEHQRKQDRQEFDLYDPDSKRTDKPARESDEDPRSHTHTHTHTQRVIHAPHTYMYIPLSVKTPHLISRTRWP